MKKIEQTLTSMEVAEMIGRGHKELLRSIRLYAKNMEKVAERTNAPGKENAEGESSPRSKEEYFKESTYEDANGQSRPCFNVTKKGCEFIAHKMNGIKGTEFTMRYIDRFHDMEEAISEGNKSLPLTLKEQIQTIAKGTEELYQRVDEVTEDVKTVKQEIEALKDDLPLFPSEAEKISNAAKKKGVEVLGGKQSNAYKDRSLQHKVYTNIYANLKYNFEVGSYKSIKRGNRHEALKIVEEYKPPYFLAEQIANANAQRNLDLKGGVQNE